MYTSKLVPLFTANPTPTRAEILPAICETAVAVLKADADGLAFLFKRLGITPEEIAATKVAFPEQTWPPFDEAPSRLKAIELLILLMFADLKEEIRQSVVARGHGGALVDMTQTTKILQAVVQAFDIDMDEAQVAADRAMKFAVGQMLVQLAGDGPDDEPSLPPSLWGKMKES